MDGLIHFSTVTTCDYETHSIFVCFDPKHWEAFLVKETDPSVVPVMSIGGSVVWSLSLDIT